MRSSIALTLIFTSLLATAPPSRAVTKPSGAEGLANRAFARQELNVPTRLVTLESARDGIVAGREDWEALLARPGSSLTAFVDERTGTLANLVGHLPLLPGSGRDNRLDWATVAERLRMKADTSSPEVVAATIRGLLAEHYAAFRIDPAELGVPRAIEVREGFWQIRFGRVYKGVPVRAAAVAATLSGGNLVLLGAERWAPIGSLEVRPRISAAQAQEAGFAFAERSLSDELSAEPKLELLATLEAGEPAVRHRLVWTYDFRREGEPGLWEVVVDADTREVLSFADLQEQVRRPMTGGAYPVTSTETCADPARCGAIRNVPMPFADAGASGITNSAGLYTAAAETTTTLNGRFVSVQDQCGSIEESATTAPLNLGGATGDHDCDHAGGSQGNTAAARTAFYELNKLTELARGWLPTLPFLQDPVTVRTNKAGFCNAFWDPSLQEINFLRDGRGCRNSGELAAVIDHEWGHGLDDNDAGGQLSKTSEGYADIVALYRQGSSCIGIGFHESGDAGCGPATDGTGQNTDNGTLTPHCALNCSGVREADWGQHADQTPDTPANLVCPVCASGPGPCGRQVHCASLPIGQAAWDLVARDLVSPPFSLDANSALILGNKLLYEGSGNVGDWYECNCAAGTSAGCSAGSGYMNWLAADDDNGSLSDGTPHMGALFAAFNRHGIACATPLPTTAPCAHTPKSAPVVTLTPGPNRMDLSWNSVLFATEYWVFRSEGTNACNLGKTRIGRVSGTSFTDSNVANGRSYSYSVMATARQGQCQGPASPCTSRTPDSATLSCTPTSLSATAGGSTQTSTCRVSSGSGSATLSCANLPPDTTCNFSPTSLTLPPDVVFTSQLVVNPGPTAPAGNFAPQVVATMGAGVARAATLQLQITTDASNFVLSCAPASLVVLPGISRTTTCTATSQNGFSGNLALSCGTGPGISCQVAGSSLTLAAGGSASVGATFTGTASATPGFRQLGVTATGGGLTRTAPVQVLVGSVD